MTTPSSTTPTDPTKIRPAATVIITRPLPGSSEAEIYMTVRSAKSPFMPSTLVFPGGRVDPEDGDLADDMTWERAARRECQEEAGLELTAPLLWFDTWLTPSGEGKRRYLARFFVARIGSGEGDHAAADGHETHDGRWATPAGHLRRWEERESDLPPPTLCTLLRLRELSFAQLGELGDLDPEQEILPKVELRPSGLEIVMPHDPAYDALPGDARPAPPRVETLPRRFVRDKEIWKPCA